MKLARELRRLVHDVEWALAHGLGRRDLEPMLKKLMGRAPEGSPEQLFAQRTLAELFVEHEPWQSLILIRRVLSRVDDARSWSIAGLAHTVLGNYRSAHRCYRHALELAPDCAATAHNLGHLLDVALERPRDALVFLQQANRADPFEKEMAASYAHALCRVGQRGRARKVLSKALGSDDPQVDELLCRWLTAATEERRVG